MRGSSDAGLGLPISAGRARYRIPDPNQPVAQTAKQKLLGDNAAVFLRLEPSTSSAVEKTEAVASGPIVPHEDQLTYSSYLKVPELLELQHPQSTPEHHDELLFIIVHQTYELWFKELLHDLDAVVRIFMACRTQRSNHTTRSTRLRGCFGVAQRSLAYWSSNSQFSKPCCQRTSWHSAAS